MATVGVARLGVVLKINDEKEFIINEGDCVHGLRYTYGKKDYTLDGCVRVICAKTISYNNGPTTCPPDPYVQNYITPTQFIIDSSDMHKATITKVDIANITDLESVSEHDDGEDVVTPDAVVGVGPSYKALNEVLESLDDGATVLLEEGEYDVPLTLDKSVTIIGVDGVTLTKPITVNATGAQSYALSRAVNEGPRITLQGLNLSGEAFIDIKNAGVFEMTDCVVGGLTTPEGESKSYPIKMAEVPMKVIIERNVFNANDDKCYNGIECTARLKDGSSVSDNVFSAGWVTHNSINFYGAEDGATIRCNGNQFGDGCSCTRVGLIGDPKNVTLLFEDNVCGHIDNEWGGLTLFQPYGTRTTSMAGITAKFNKNVNEQDLCYIYGGTSLKTTKTNAPTVYIDGERVDVPGPLCMERSVEGWEKGWDDPTYQKNLENYMGGITEADSAASFKEALTSDNGGVVKLTQPIQFTEKITVKGDVTVDLNDQGLSGSGSAGIIVASGETAHLTIKGNGTLRNPDTYVLQASNGGIIDIESGAAVESGGAATVVLSGSTLNVNGGSIKNINAAGKPGVQAQKASTVVVNSGSVEGTEYGIKAISGSSAVINNGTVKGNMGGIYGSNSATSGTTPGTITVKGGTVDGTGSFGANLFDGVGLIIDGGTMTGVAGATINGSKGNENAYINFKKGIATGTVCGLYLPNGTLNLEDGATITGPVGLMVRGGTLNMTGGVITGVDGVANKIGDAGYTTEPAALAIDKNNGYNGGNVAVNISGGTINAKDAESDAITYSEGGVIQSGEESYTGIVIDGAKITGKVFGKV